MSTISEGGGHVSTTLMKDLQHMLLCTVSLRIVGTVTWSR